MNRCSSTHNNQGGNPHLLVPKMITVRDKNFDQKVEGSSNTDSEKQRNKYEPPREEKEGKLNKNNNS